MKCIILATFLLLSESIWAQELKLAGIEYLNYPTVQLKDEAQNNRASFQEFGAYVNYPVVSKNKKVIIINGLQYGLVKVSVYNSVSNASTTNNFQGIAYSLTVIHRWNDKWTVIGRLSPTLASDFSDKLSSSDFALQGSVLALKKIRGDLSVGGGLIYSTRLGKPLLIPCLQLKYKKDRNSLDVLLPIFINYAYQVDSRDRLKIGFKVAINGANFNTGIHTLSNNADMDRLNYSRTNIGPSISYQLNNVLQIEGSGGLSTMRSYQFSDMQDNTYKYNSKSGTFFKIGLAVTPPKKRS